MVKENKYGSRTSSETSTSSLKTALVGVGSLGTAIGGFLIRSGVDIDLVDSDKNIVRALREKGIRITGTTTFYTDKVHALFPQEMTPGYDIILLATKATHNKEVVPFLAPLLKENGVIVSLQDGLPEEYISTVVGKNRTMGCTVEWGASLVEPGVTEITSNPDFLSVHVGRMEGVSSGQLMNVRNLMGKAVVVHYENNLLNARWGRLLFCCSLSAINAIIGGVYSDIFAGPWKRRCIALSAMKECFEVAKKRGANISTLQGKNLKFAFYYKTVLKKWLNALFMPNYLHNHRKIHASMLEDIKRGMKTEADLVNGVIIEAGEKYSVPTPVNRKLLDIIHLEEEGEIYPSKDNLKDF